MNNNVFPPSGFAPVSLTYGIKGWFVYAGFIPEAHAYSLNSLGNLLTNSHPGVSLVA